MVQELGDGCHAVNPFIVVEGAADFLAFCAAVFDGEETERITGPEERIAHAEMRIGDSIIMVSDASLAFPARPCAHYVFVRDVDATYRRAVAAQAVSLREPTNQFYGNREAGVTDPYGNVWWIATAVEAVSPQELQRRWQVMNG